MQVTVGQAFCLPAWYVRFIGNTILALFRGAIFDLPTIDFLLNGFGKLRFCLPVIIEFAQEEDQQGCPGSNIFHCSSHAKPVIFFATLNPFSNCEENGDRDEHANDQDDGQCDCVHEILLSFNCA